MTQLHGHGLGSLLQGAPGNVLGRRQRDVVLAARACQDHLLRGPHGQMHLSVGWHTATVQAGWQRAVGLCMQEWPWQDMPWTG